MNVVFRDRKVDSLNHSFEKSPSAGDDKKTSVNGKERRLVDHIDVIVNDVDMSDIRNLNSVLTDLKNQNNSDTILNTTTDAMIYKIKLAPADLAEIKETLRFILQVIEPKRIAIEP